MRDAAPGLQGTEPAAPRNQPAPASGKTKNARCHFLAAKLKHKSSNSSTASFFTYPGNTGNFQHLTEGFFPQDYDFV